MTLTTPRLRRFFAYNLLMSATIESAGRSRSGRDVHLNPCHKKIT